jgi:hypothetical protein
MSRSGAVEPSQLLVDLSMFIHNISAHSGEARARAATHKPPHWDEGCHMSQRVCMVLPNGCSIQMLCLV